MPEIVNTSWSSGLLLIVVIGFWRMKIHDSYEFPGERLLQNGLAEAGGALEVGRHHRLQLLHHAQPPLHFRHDPRLLGEGWNADWNILQLAEADCLHSSTLLPTANQISHRLRFQAIKKVVLAQARLWNHAEQVVRDQIGRASCRER